MQKQIVISRDKIAEMARIIVDHPAAQSIALNEGEYIDMNGLANQIASQAAQQQCAAPPPAGVRCESIQQMVQEVFSRQGEAPEKYLSKPVRMLKLRNTYKIHDHEIPAGDYLVEAKSSNGAQWVPMSAQFVQENYKPFIPVDKSRVSIQKNVIKELMGSMNKAIEILHSATKRFTSHIEAAIARNEN